MNRKYLSTTIFGAALLLFAACTNDELTDGTDALPEGMYPLEIASVTMEAESSVQPWGAKSPQTRVIDDPNGTYSEWEYEDEFHVKFDGSDEVGTYQITNAHSSPVTVKASTPVYWPSASKQQTIIAWHAPDADADGKLTLSDQSKKLIYLIRAQQTATYSNGAAVSLDFKHQFAKVRVQFTGTNKSKVQEVKIGGYTSCTVTEGTVSADDAQTGDITMRKTILLSGGTECWEANMVPGEIKTIKVNGATATLKQSVTTTAGELCTITIGVNPIAVTGGEITEAGDYIVTGSVTETITLNGDGINLTLKDASINVSSGNGINITSGSPTIRVEGANNTVKSSNGAGIYVAEGSTVNITGDSRNDQLTVTGGKSGSGIGACNQACGNIAISNITVNARGVFTDVDYSEGTGYSAGIGGSGSHACGTISIDNATVYAYGMTDYFWAGNQVTPGIGGGLDGDTKGSYGAITINNSTVYTYRGSDKCDYIGSAGSTAFPASSPAGIDCNGGGIFSSTVNCYTQTSKTESTLDKTIVYDADGTGTEQ